MCAGVKTYAAFQTIYAVSVSFFLSVLKVAKSKAASARRAFSQIFASLQAFYPSKLVPSPGK